MLLAWDFKYFDAAGQERETRTAQVLLDEVSYPVMMHQVIAIAPGAPIRRSTFVPKGASPAAERGRAAALGSRGGESWFERRRYPELEDGFGFITPTGGGPNLFFFHAEVIDADFNDLHVGDSVNYSIGKNDRGPCAVDVYVTRQTVSGVA